MEIRTILKKYGQLGQIKKLKKLEKIEKIDISYQLNNNLNKRTQSEKRDVEARCDARA